MLCWSGPVCRWARRLEMHVRRAVAIPRRRKARALAISRGHRSGTRMLSRRRSAALVRQAPSQGSSRDCCRLHLNRRVGFATPAQRDGRDERGPLHRRLRCEAYGGLLTVSCQRVDQAHVTSSHFGLRFRSIATVHWYRRLSYSKTKLPVIPFSWLICLRR